ncbi:MAG: hypothetical protein AB7I01_17290 [Gammaproteobacteria bacterium]
MTLPAPTRRVALLATVLALGLAACVTPQRKPDSTVVVTVPNGPTAPRAPTAGGAGQGQGGEGQGYGRAVPDAAVVTAEEVSADGQVRRIGDGGETADEEAAAGAAGRPGGGGGRTPPTRYALPAETSSAGGTVVAHEPTPDTHDPAWTGSDVGERDAHVDDNVTAPHITDLERAKRDAAARLGVQSGLEDGRGGRTGDSLGARGAGGAADTATGLGNTPDLSGARSGEHRAQPLAARTLGEAEAAQDDALALQLRAAALREQDPALRDKLWAEYRRYKAGLEAAP